MTTATRYDREDLDYLAFLISAALSDRRDDMPSITEIDVDSDDIVELLPALLDTLAARTRTRRTAELSADRAPRTCRYCDQPIWLDTDGGMWFDARPAWCPSEVCPSSEIHEPTEES